jgi:hypothetical protein
VFIQTLGALESVFRIRSFLVQIRIRGSVALITEYTDLFFLFLAVGTLSSVVKDSKLFGSHNTVFFILFCIQIRIRKIIKDPDPGSLKSY